MDRSWKSEILLGTSQAKQITGKMVSEVARLWLCTMTYSREDEYESRYFIEKGPSQYKRRQQGCAITEGWNVDKKNHCQDYNVGKKNNDRRKRYNQENLKE